MITIQKMAVIDLVINNFAHMTGLKYQPSTDKEQQGMFCFDGFTFDFFTIVFFIRHRISLSEIYTWYCHNQKTDNKITAFEWFKNLI